MLYFMSDYTEGAHPKVLAHLCEKNLVSLPGYGFDESTDAAKAKICKACGRDDLQIQFLVGGTQTNQVAISTLLREDEAVITACTGHITEHEAGAIEATGHKVLTVPQHDGMIDAGELREYCETFYADDNHEHMVFPGMVYISHPTEYGTLYTKAQLEAIAAVCHEYHMSLFIDGARLGYGLVASGTDVTLPDIARIVDVFYIGGTKVGALFGEAVVFTKGNMPKHFTAQIKQHGALMAKGWLMGLQFDTLFTDGLYTRIARNADEMADRIREALRAKGYRMVYENTTNQIFVSFDHATIERLEREVRLGFMERYDDDHTVMRICTSWATTAESVDRLIGLL